MKFKQIVMVASISISFFYCGSKSITKEASHSLETLQKELSTSSCDGKGTSFSGIYDVSARVGKAQCDGDEPIELVDTDFSLSCTQKDSAFACKVSSDYTWSGCINHDGSFVLGVQESADYMKNLMKLTENATSVQAMGKLSGKIQNDGGEGTLYFAMLATSSKSKKGCTGSWPISIELGQKSDNTENSQK